MAFSMFLRNSACSNILREQLKRLTLQSALSTPMAQRSISSLLPVSSVALKKANSTPIFNSVRSFRTSSVRLSDEHPHDHARLWVIEKATTVLMVPLVPLGLLIPNKLIDSILAILIVAHSFWGLEAIAVDYVRASIFGPVIPKIAIGLVYVISIATLGGLFYIISHDVGICNTIKQFWSVKADKS